MQKLETLLFLIYIFVGSVQANLLKADLCDCKEMKETGVIEFDDSSCESELKAEVSTEVSYGMYTVKPLISNIEAIVCTVWYRRKVIDTAWYGSTDVTLYSVPKDITGDECRDLFRTKQCDGNLINPSGENYWIFNDVPTGGSKLGSTTTVNLLNCEIRLINVSHPCLDCKIDTPLGKMGVKDYSISRAHITLVINGGFSRNTETCSQRMLTRGYGVITNSIDNGTKRFQDFENQLDFHLFFNATNCFCGYDNTCKDPCHKILNNDNIVICIEPITDDPDLPLGDYPSKRPGFKPILPRLHENLLKTNRKKNKKDATADVPVNDLTAFHVQFNLDLEIDISNSIAREVLYNQCQIQRIRHYQALTMANLNPFLAAKNLDLPICSKLKAIGNFVILQQCATKSIVFSTFISQCGAQLQKGEFGISSNGFELVPFQKCGINSHFANVAGKLYFFNGTYWNEAKPTVFLKHMELEHNFLYPNDNSLQTALRHPGQEVENDLTIADLINTRKQPGKNPGILPHAQTFLESMTDSHSFIGELKFYGLICLIFVFGLILLKCLHFFGIFSMFFKIFSCFKTQREPVSNHQHYPLVQRD